MWIVSQVSTTASLLSQDEFLNLARLPSHDHTWIAWALVSQQRLVTGEVCCRLMV